MFVRKKPNKRRVIIVEIISKSCGSYELVRTVGSSSDPETIGPLYWEAKREIDEMTGVLQLNFDKYREKELVELFFHHIEGWELAGPELLLGKVFDQIGFNAIKDELFSATWSSVGLFIGS